jgi:hypothetical protein
MSGCFDFGVGAGEDICTRGLVCITDPSAMAMPRLQFWQMVEMACTLSLCECPQAGQVICCLGMVVFLRNINVAPAKRWRYENQTTKKSGQHEVFRSWIGGVAGATITP